jgi:hypothetical protein
MEAALLFWLASLFYASDHAGDPIQQAWQGREHTRQLECERLSQAEAHRRSPAEVPPPAARTATMMQLDALVCARRVVPWGKSDPRDEVILTTLSDEVAAIVNAAASAIEGDGRVFVDAFYPQPEIAQKIANATRIGLADAGRRVGSRAPLLAAGDVEVVGAMSLMQALPITCARLKAEGSLTDNDAIVVVAIVRDNETQLHGGVCQKGRFQWLR